MKPGHELLENLMRLIIDVERDLLSGRDAMNDHHLKSMIGQDQSMLKSNVSQNASRLNVKYEDL